MINVHFFLGWAACPRPDFSARFDCTSRTYKYFFPRGDLNLFKMNEAGKFLLGEHDFRNFCKMDVAHGVVNYHRRIISVEAKSVSNEKSPFDMCVLRITGKAFLWHQIRCIGMISHVKNLTFPKEVDRCNRNGQLQARTLKRVRVKAGNFYRKFFLLKKYI